MREAPDYPLERRANVISGERAQAEEALEVAGEVPVEETEEPMTLFDQTVG